MGTRLGLYCAGNLQVFWGRQVFRGYMLATGSSYGLAGPGSEVHVGYLLGLHLGTPYTLSPYINLLFHFGMIQTFLMGQPTGPMGHVGPSLWLQVGSVQVLMEQLSSMFIFPIAVGQVFRP